MDCVVSSSVSASVLPTGGLVSEAFKRKFMHGTRYEDFEIGKLYSSEAALQLNDLKGAKSSDFILDGSTFLWSDIATEPKTPYILLEKGHVKDQTISYSKNSFFSSGKIYYLVFLVDSKRAVYHKFFYDDGFEARFGNLVHAFFAGIYELSK